MGDDIVGKKPYDENMLKKASTLASAGKLNRSRLKSPAMIADVDDSVTDSRMCDISSMNKVGHKFGGL